MVESALTKRSAHDQYAKATTKQAFDGEYSPDSVIVTLSIALALYNSLEMVLLLLSTFKRWRGLYFWSLCVCNLGVILYALGIMLTFFKLAIAWLNLVILDIGWVAMLSAQSLVLYSRLGLLLDSSKILASVKWMIIVDSISICTIVLVLNLGSSFSAIASFAEGYYYIEQIQLILFTVQESIISGLYVWKTLALLKVVSKENTRTMIWQLFVINVIIISMDIAIVTLQYLHYQLYQESIKGFVYSVKLKLELNILSKLVDLVDGTSGNRSMTLDIIDSNAIAGQARADVQRELSESGHFGKRFGHDDKSTLTKIDEGIEDGPSCSQTSTRPFDDNESIVRVFSNQSRHTTRTSGGESDVMYAEILRSIK